MAGDHEDLFRRLSRSAFRSRFKLAEKDLAYLEEKGLETIARHAADFIAGRLVPALPKNDGKQTPLRGHPVFTSQHATATCCRGCLEKWHGIEKGRELTEAEQRYVADVIRAWLEKALRPG